MSENTDLGYINIRITSTDVEYDTELSTSELVFWLETLKSMVLKQVIVDGDNAAQ